MIEIDIDLTELENHIKRISRQPDKKMITSLNAVLASQTNIVRAAVHIDTGSLKASVRSKNKKSASRWIGIISAGGPSPGSINNPVNYAIYEQRRRGAHDFMLPLDALHKQYVKAILEGLD